MEDRGVRRARQASVVAASAAIIGGIGPYFVLGLVGGTPGLGILGLQLLPSRVPGAPGVGLQDSVAALVAVGAALSALGFILYVGSFGHIGRVSHDFRTARGLGLIGTAGYVIAAVGPAITLAVYLSAGDCTTAAGCTYNQSPLLTSILLTFFGTVLGKSVFFLLGPALALVGWIALILGVFRMGTRYNSGLLKVAAILFIIPLASIVAPILAFVALRKVAPVGDGVVTA